MTTKSTEKKTSLEPSEVFCAVGLLIPTSRMRELVKDKTGTELLKWASTDGLKKAKEGIKPFDPKFEKMFKDCANLNRDATDLKKRTDMVANIVAGFSGAIGSKVFMRAMNTSVDIVDKVYMTGSVWPQEVNKFRMQDADSKFDYNSSDLVLQVGAKKFFGISLKKKPNVTKPDPTIINKAFSTFLTSTETKVVKMSNDLNKVRQDYFAGIVKKAQEDGIINVRGLPTMTTEQVWNAKLKRPPKPGKTKSETIALINLKGFNEKDDPVVLSDVPGTVEQITVYDKPRGRMGLKDYINADLSKDDNDLFAKFSEIIDEKADFFADTLIDMVLKTQLNTKLKAKDIGDFNFEFALVTGFADYKPNNKDATKDQLRLRGATYIPLHTILCGLANLAGAEDKFTIKPDTKKKEEANAAKVYYQLSKQNVPILDLELRYKGDFKAQPQFFATITKKFKEQMYKACLVKKRAKKQNEITILNQKKLAA